MKAAWPALPAKLTLIGVAYASGSLRLCTAALFELLRLEPGLLAEGPKPPGRRSSPRAHHAASAAAAPAPPQHISQVNFYETLSAY